MTIADLENRLSIARQQLAREVEVQPPIGRIPYYSMSSGSTGRASIQLQGVSSGSGSGSGYRHSGHASSSAPGRRPFVKKEAHHVSSLSASAAPFVPAARPAPKKAFDVLSVPLSAVLHPSEEVIFRIIIRKDQNGQNEYAVLVAVFDGSQLVVAGCETAPSLIGLASVKPGEILYRFMEALKENGLLRRSFTVAPWRLCSVVREGREETLEELRRKFLQSRELGQQVQQVQQVQVEQPVEEEAKEVEDAL
jgi:hypothetical protein